MLLKYVWETGRCATNEKKTVNSSFLQRIFFQIEKVQNKAIATLD